MIFVECKPDKLLVRIIADIPRKTIRHAGNKFEVIKRLSKYSQGLGIIDEDPGRNQPIQLKTAKEISTQDIKAADLILLSYKSNLVLIIRPRLEEWILKTAKELNVNPKDFKLPDDPEQLHSIINYNLDKFERFLNKIKHRKQKSKRVLTLTYII